MLNKDDILHNRYRIISRLAEGGMGAVYRAEDTKRFNKTVALKEVLIELNSNNADALRRAFEREAKILTQIEHEAVPKVIDYFLVTDCQFLVMELIEGDDLTGILQKRRTWFPLENVMNWAHQLLDALDYLHSLNPPIIHRDIKPQNLKLNSRGKIKLLDFGIAKDTISELSATLTDHTFVGATLHYSPFEQIIRLPFYYEPLHSLYGDKVNNFLRQSADARSDIYSLGATLYHLLTNVEPVGAYQRTLEVWAGKYDPLKPPHKIAPHLSPQISVFLLKSLELERENRFSSAAEMKTALQDIIWEEKRRDYEEDQAVLVAEHKKLKLERESLEAEKLSLQAEREENLRQIAAEREQQLLEKEERELQIFKQEQMRFEHQERERLLHNEREETEKREAERLRLEAEKQEIERKRLEAEAQKDEIERQRILEDSERAKEREELEETRRQIEAEKRWLKIQHEESLRQIAAERERVKHEEELKSLELERLENERLRIEIERQRFEVAEQERERRRLEEEEQKQLEREEIEAERLKLEAERQRLEIQEKERQQKLREEAGKLKREREELENVRLLEAEKAEKLKIAAELERRKIEKEQAEEREKLRLEAFERERIRIETEAREKLRIETEEREKLRLVEEEKEFQRLENERLRLEAEQRKRDEEAKQKRLEEIEAAAKIENLDTITEFPAEDTLAYTSAQMSPFATLIDVKPDAEEKTEAATLALFPAEEIQTEVLEIEVKKPEIAEQKNDFEVEKIAVEDYSAPVFASEPQRNSARIAVIAVIGLLFLAASAFGIWMMSGGGADENAVNAANNSAAPTPTAAPSVEPSVEPSVLSETTPTPATGQTKEKPKITATPMQIKTPVPVQKTPVPVQKTPKPTQDPNCVFTNNCK